MENINKVVRERCNLLESSNKTLQDVYNVMFKNPNYILGETNDGYRIKKYTYGDVEKRINQIAYSLNIEYPTLKDSYIGIELDSSVEWIEAYWGILKSGNKPYLINLRHTEKLVNSLLESLDVRYVISLGNTRYNASAININDLNKEPIEDYNYTFADEMALSTSATTLKEKIIFYSGKEISAQILNAREVVKQNKLIKKHYKGSLKQLIFLPLYHIFGFMATYMWFSYFGRTLVFLNDYSSNTILRTIKKHEVTHIFAVPLFWNTIEKEVLKTIKQKELEKKFECGQNLCLKLQSMFGGLGIKLSKKIMKEVTDALFGPSVFFCISGGSYIKDSTVRLFNSIGYPLHNGYGMSEVGITSVELGNVKNRLKNSIGKPFGSVEYKIENNELYVKGDSISHKMKIDGEIVYNDDSWFKTNDLVSLDAGRYYINGRIDDLFIGPNGENINPDLIEKEFRIEKAKRYSILEINNKLSIVVEIDRYTPKTVINTTYSYITEKNNELDSSMRVQTIYFTYDPIANENAIKVSRQYLKRLLDNNEVNLLNITDICKENEEKAQVDEIILNKINDFFKEVLNISLAEDNSNFFFDLNGTSLDYFSLISMINTEFNVKITFDGNVLHTPYALAVEVERLLNL